MCETLSKFVNIGTFNILQDKLEDWLDNFKFNTCDQNVARGCEIIELNAKVQGQLFKLLNLCASEGGVYGGASVIKSRLLPILGQGFFSAGLSTNTTLKELGEINQKRHSLKDVKKSYENSLNDYEYDLKESQSENETLRMELEEAKIELDRQERQSSSEKMFDKQEIQNLKEELKNITNHNNLLKNKSNVIETHEQEFEQLKDGITNRSTYRNLHSSRCLSPCKRYHSAHDPCHHSGCALDSCYFHVDHCDPLCYAKQQNLVSGFNDLFSLSRTEAINLLSRYSDNQKNNQKIIFHAVMESFYISKATFRIYKSKIRSDMIGHHSGCSLEESVQHYITDHADHEIDLSQLSREVIQALEFKSSLISRPSGLGFDIINSFIRDACKIAWSMCSLPIPLDLYRPATDGELFDESHYRRSYNSEYDAAFVYHHIWPCLTKNGLIIAKGEAVTKRTVSKSLIRCDRSPNSSLNLTSDRFSMPSCRSMSPINVRSKSPVSKRGF